MLTRNFIILSICIFCIYSFKSENKSISQSEDYNSFLQYHAEQEIKKAQDEYAFWSLKLEKTPNQFPYLSKMAAAQNTLFSLTGDVGHLNESTLLLEKAVQKTNAQKSGILRSLAKNYISQHRFRESLDMLDQAELLGDQLIATQKMLYDVHMELGNDEWALCYLESLGDKADFDFLIRLSKWKDHIGQLDHAIELMEFALEDAEKKGNKELIQWSTTNLADFYGHAARIEESYESFIKALQLDPSDAYAKKGIAWIVFSYERNADEAMRIINSIENQYKTPDYYLLKSDIASYQGNLYQAALYQEQYESMLANQNYGNMYNKYNIELWVEDQNQVAQAIEVCNAEIDMRPTAQSYALLAWSTYKKGDAKKALEIMENHVSGKTHEPEALFYLASIYKANQKWNEVNELKPELEDSAFELGPIMEREIAEL